MAHFTQKMYWLHCLSPLHVGANEGAGYIDNPIMREKVTGWPFVPGSSVKGVLKNEVVKNNLLSDNEINKAFGKNSDDQANVGALIFSDAHLICLPVRSIYGTFAWVTSPLVLKRLQRDWPQLAQCQFGEWNGENNIYLSEPSVLKSEGSEKIFLEDLDLNVQNDKNMATKLAESLAKALWPPPKHDDGEKKYADWKRLFQERFAVVSDGVFDFLAQTATQIDTRIRIENGTKTVAAGALWTEEYLPAETLLAGVILQDQYLAAQDNPLSKLCAKEFNLQLGGNITVGRGQVRCQFGE